MILISMAVVGAGMLLFSDYSRRLREVTDADTYDKYYVMITNDRKSAF